MREIFTQKVWTSRTANTRNYRFTGKIHWHSHCLSQIHENIRPVFFGGNNFDGYNSSRLEFYFCPDLDSGQRVDEFIVRQFKPLSTKTTPFGCHTNPLMMLPPDSFTMAPTASAWWLRMRATSIIFQWLFPPTPADNSFIKQTRWSILLSKDQKPLRKRVILSQL